MKTKTRKTKTRRETFPQCRDCSGRHAPPEARCARYNGWTNYETWSVALHLDNDQGSYTYWAEQTREALAAAHDLPPAYPSQTERDHALYILSEQLREDIKDGQVPDLGETLYAQLLGGALSDVNWYEIAEHMIEGAE